MGSLTYSGSGFLGGHSAISLVGGLDGSTQPDSRLCAIARRRVIVMIAVMVFVAVGALQLRDGCAGAVSGVQG